MYLFLWVLGGVTTVAGFTLIVRQAAFEADVITPGTIAIVGGLILIGLGLVVRGLQRVEQVLAARTAPRAARPGELPAIAVERASAPARIPFPPKPKTEPRPQAAPPAAEPPPAAAAAEGAGSERLREKFPTLVRLENAPVVDEAAVSLLLQASGRAEEDVSEVRSVSVAGQAAGGAPARIVPRLEVKSAASGSPDRNKISMFDSFWPKGQRARRDAQAAPAQEAVPPAAVSVEQAPNGAPPAEAASAERPQPAAEPVNATSVSILKSGVVEGMAYTLYSDGSIEAQLPQGTLRFGSITELRNHIENAS